MAKRRLKSDPGAIDLALAGLMTARGDHSPNGGYYALLALGRLLEKNLPGETGKITALNIQRRLDRLCHEMNFSPADADEIHQGWKALRTHLERKDCSLPSYRRRRVRLFAELVARVFEEYAGVHINDVAGQMTVADLARLEAGFGEDLGTAECRPTPCPGLTLGDFESIFTLRERLGEFGVRLGKSFPDRMGLEKGPEITAADFTSSWAAVSLMSPFRGGGEEAGFHILATPEGVGAGLVFADTAEGTRRRYYQALSRGEMENELAGLDRAGAELVDVYWYCFIEARRRIKDTPPGELAELARAAGENPGKAPFTASRLLSWRWWSREEAVGAGEKLLEQIKVLYPPTAALVRSLSGAQ